MSQDTIATTRVTVLYEDRTTGLRAKRFSDNLKSAMPSEVSEAAGFWRLELLDLPEVAHQVIEQAAASDFLVVSLRGDRNFTEVARRLVERWGAEGTARGLTFVVLFDPYRTEFRVAQALRSYFRNIAEKFGIAFFCVCTASPEIGEDESPEDTVEDACPERGGFSVSPLPEGRRAA